MGKYHRWLHNEIAAWLADELIDPRQAEQLRVRYPLSGGITWSRLIFSIIGAVIFGLGVILFFAYNWAEMPKYLKLGVVFGSLVLAHGLGFRFTTPDKDNRSLGEGLHVLGTMLFGAGIWLVAQIYHIDEHYPNAFLVWGTGALALAWA